MKYYVLKYQNGSLVGIDRDSGGYPWQAWKESEPNGSMCHVAMWPYNDYGKQNALEYSGTNKFELAILECNILTVIDKSDCY